MTNPEEVTRYIFIAFSTIVIFLILIIYAVKLLLKEQALSFVDKNKKSIRKSTLKLAEKCEKKADNIAGSYEDYEEAIRNLQLNKIVSCSSSVASNAERNKVKYLLKYTGLDYDYETIDRLDIAQDFLKKYCKFLEETGNLVTKFRRQIPIQYQKYLSNEYLLETVCDIPESMLQIKYPCVIFRYISAAGRSGFDTTITIDDDLIPKIIDDIYKKLGKKGHTKRQRSAMTSDLREAIKKRDDYTCQICGNSVYEEPNLLLEVDHIIPVSKGGKTEADNLQTLCWRCNRKKHDK